MENVNYPFLTLQMVLQDLRQFSENELWGNLSLKGKYGTVVVQEPLWV